jgi:hypothetical protein
MERGGCFPRLQEMKRRYYDQLPIYFNVSKSFKVSVLISSSFILNLNCIQLSVDLLNPNHRRYRSSSSVSLRVLGMFFPHTFYTVWVCMCEEQGKIWPRVPRDSDPRMTALARASSNCKRQTPPLVRESAPHQQTRNCLAVIKTWS